LQACAHIPAGEEIVGSYGDHDNAHLLLYYGFTVPNSPFPASRLDLGGQSAELLMQGADSPLRHGRGEQDAPPPAAGGHASADSSALEALRAKERHHLSMIARSDIRDDVRIIYKDELVMIRRALGDGLAVDSALSRFKKTDFT
jgi:hypothetical protein